MNINNAFVLKEAEAKDAVLQVLKNLAADGILSTEQFHEIRPKIEAAFREADETWKNKILPKIFGPTGAIRFLEELEKDYPFLR